MSGGIHEQDQVLSSGGLIFRVNYDQIGVNGKNI